MGPTQDYHTRMQRVLDHVDRYVDCELNLAQLSHVAGLSMYHFHRQFTATFGLPVQHYVRLARIRRASYRLIRVPDESVTSIAMDAGYETPDSFARAFRRHTGQSPSAFRKSPNWTSWEAAFEPFNGARASIAAQCLDSGNVTIRDVPATLVVQMEHRGNPASIRATIQRFIEWRETAGLAPKVSATFTIFHDDPRSTPANEFRITLCAATDRPVEPNGSGVAQGVIPAGRCAVLSSTGMSDNLEPMALFLYRDWLPASGEELRDFPIYCQRISFCPDVPEHESRTELYLPLADHPREAAATGNLQNGEAA